MYGNKLVRRKITTNTQYRKLHILVCMKCNCKRDIALVKDDRSAKLKWKILIRDLKSTIKLYGLITLRRDIARLHVLVLANLSYTSTSGQLFSWNSLNYSPATNSNGVFNWKESVEMVEAKCTTICYSGKTNNKFHRFASVNYMRVGFEMYSYKSTVCIYQVEKNLKRVQVFVFVYVNGVTVDGWYTWSDEIMDMVRQVLKWNWIFRWRCVAGVFTFHRKNCYFFLVSTWRQIDRLKYGKISIGLLISCRNLKRYFLPFGKFFYCVFEAFYQTIELLVKVVWKTTTTTTTKRLTIL